MQRVGWRHGSCFVGFVLLARQLAACSVDAGALSPSGDGGAQLQDDGRNADTGRDDAAALADGADGADAVSQPDAEADADAGQPDADANAPTDADADAMGFAEIERRGIYRARWP